MVRWSRPACRRPRQLRQETAVSAGYLRRSKLRENSTEFTDIYRAAAIGVCHLEERVEIREVEAHAETTHGLLELLAVKQACTAKDTQAPSSVQPFVSHEWDRGAGMQACVSPSNT